jgi:uncharacterized membrane protein
MGRKERVWLLTELPTLVSEGVVDAGTAEKLRRRYAADAQPGRGWGMIVCGVLGALLIGLGVILLLAHNWQDLSRPARTLLAFAPLAITQALVFAGQARGWRSAAWRETTGLLWTLAVGACIALIAQTYHMPGDMEGFTIVWAWLVLPILLFTQAATVLAAYFALLLAWASFSQLYGGVALLFWPLAAAAFPVVRAEVRSSPYGARTVWMLWVVALACTAAIGITLEKAMPGLWILTYAGALAVLYLIGGYWGAAAPTLWQRPLHTLGSCGIVVLTYLLTFDWPWHEIGFERYRDDPACHPLAAGFDYALAVALPVWAALLLVTAVRRGEARRIPFGLLPVVAAVGYIAVGTVSHPIAWVPVFLCNAYLFILGLATLIQGVRDRRMGTVNAGMLILMALILTRFFDSDYSLVAKGIVFILLGAAFMSVNMVLMRRRKEVAA